MHKRKKGRCSCLIDFRSYSKYVYNYHENVSFAKSKAQLCFFLKTFSGRTCINTNKEDVHPLSELKYNVEFLFI